MVASKVVLSGQYPIGKLNWISDFEIAPLIQTAGMNDVDVEETSGMMDLAQRENPGLGLVLNRLKTIFIRK